MTIEDIVTANEVAARNLFSQEIAKARRVADEIARRLPLIVARLGDPAILVHPLDVRVDDWVVFKMDSEALVESLRRLEEAKRAMMVMNALREALKGVNGNA